MIIDTDTDTDNDRQNRQGLSTDITSNYRVYGELKDTLSNQLPSPPPQKDLKRISPRAARGLNRENTLNQSRPSGISPSRPLYFGEAP